MKIMKILVSAQCCQAIQLTPGKYCKFKNFRENFIFANNVKRHICDVKNSPLGHDLPRSVHDRVILPFGEGFIFTEICICEVSQKKLS